MTQDKEREAWKVGNEFAPYHPDASHVSPEYRDGWNACYRAALTSQPKGTQERQPLTDEQALRQLECPPDPEAVDRTLLAESETDNALASQRTETLAEQAGEREARELLTFLDSAAFPREDIDLDLVWRVASEALQRTEQREPWQPIETAPKDGTLFLGWISAVRYGETDEGQQYQHDVSQVDFCQWRAQPDMDCGWFEACAGRVGDAEEITHWMPLPAAPCITKKEG